MPSPVDAKSTESPKTRKPPLPSEEIHLPGPHPARGIYGFALYIVTWCLLVVYLIWAITPVPILRRLGITYIPSKLWALVIGALFPSLAFFYVTTIFLVNCWRFRGIFDNVEQVKHDFGEPRKSAKNQNQKKRN